LGPGDGFGERLREALLRAGQTVERAEGPSSADALRDRLGSLFQGNSPTAVVHLAGLDERGTAGDQELLRSVQRTCEGALRTVQTLIGKGYRDVPRLWLLTRGAQAVGAEDVSVDQSPLLGLGRTVALEHPELRCTRLDLDPKQPEDEAAVVMAELLADDAEEELAHRGGQRWVSRLVHRAPASAPRARAEPAQGRSFHLVPEGAGSDGRLVLRAVERRCPGPGEVEIAVEAAGVEARDVRALEEAAGGSESADPPAPQPGSGCAGRVVAVGEGVQGLALGDSVIALAPGCFASHVIGSASWVVPAPQGLTSAQAAAIPVAFLTAYCALARLARLQPGERVLIHEGTTSVGLAALQWAQHVGAAVYATAGSAEKRAHLTSLGVRYVSDSQSDRFVEDVLRWTDGQGVDVVLNTLGGELIPRSLELLREQGRFVELGVREDYAGVQLGLRPFLRNLSFSRMDLGVMLRSQPAQVRSLLQEVAGLFAAGVFVPPPIEERSIGNAADALRRMAQTQPIGSLVLSPVDPELRIQVPETGSVTIRKDGSYLISGGLGGLGLSVAAWLAEQGAGQLVLLSRNGAQSEAQQAAVEALRARGSQVLVAHADVADREGVASVLRALDASGLPLRGVIHAAGGLADGVLMQQTPERFERVLRPKVQGAWNLHELTAQRELDFFVMYSSAAGLMGSPGQGNYAAANSFLDALAHLRRSRGMHGLSIDWGTFSEVGLAAAEKNRGERLALRGMRSLRPQEGLQVLRGLLGTSEAQVGVVPLNLRQWGAFHQVALASPRLSELRKESAEAPSEGDRELLGKLRAAPSTARAGLIAEHLRGQVAHVLRVAEEKVELDTPLTSLGLDSLMGLELRNRVEALFGIKMPATLLWTYPTLTALSGQLAKSIAGPHDEQAAEVAAESAADAQPDAVEIADEEELLALLDESIARAERKVLR
jgi:NADPH:quinone reductase-like Zn-dependent oxidoreductase/NAD(P)-dependent dehydrogenase (short-subunit alcohol dehydrogenase family)/acyl carrier protein